jgi:hypothetical protein
MLKHIVVVFYLATLRKSKDGVSWKYIQYFIYSITFIRRETWILKKNYNSGDKMYETQSRLQFTRP